MTQVDFLSQYIATIIEDVGLKLSEEQKNVYIPRLTSLLEERIGLEMLPKLSDDQMEQFLDLVEGQEASTAKDWEDFWHGAVPSFDEDLARILKEFRTDMLENI